MKLVDLVKQWWAPSKQKKKPNARRRMEIESLEDRVVLNGNPLSDGEILEELHRPPLYSQVGDTLATASRIHAPVELRSSLGDESPLDVDMFSFEATIGSTVRAITSRYFAYDNADTYLRLFDANGLQLASNDDGGEDFFSDLTHTFAATGTYFLGVSGYPNTAYNPNVLFSGQSGGQGDYRLQVYMSAPADAGDTLGTATNTMLGPGSGSYSKVANIGDGAFGARDVDLYRFEANAGSSLTAYTSQPAGGAWLDSYLRLFDANGNQLASDDDSGDGTYSILNHTFTTSGTFFLGVSSFYTGSYNPTVGGSGNSSWNKGDYRLDMSLTSGVSIGDVTVTEGDEGTVNAVFPVSLSAPSHLPVTVQYATANGTALAGSDYVAVSTGTLTFAPGEMTRTITVAVLGGTRNEGNETFFVNLTGSGNAFGVDTQAVATIVDNDPLPSLSITDVTMTEGNTGVKFFDFTVNLSAVSDRTVTVNFATVNGTATATGDFSNPSGPLTFAPGVTSQRVSVLVNGDSVVEPNETFFVNLSGASNAIITDAQGVGTILNDDLSVAINDVTVGENGLATFTVSLSAAAAFPVSVKYATANGASSAALAGSDYQIASGTVTFAAGQMSQTITVPILADATDEANERFFVNLSNASHAVIADFQGVATITDDDAPPNISINDVSVTEGLAGTKIVTFTASLSAASGQTVTVNYATTDGSATAGSDYVAKSGMLTFAPGVTSQTITVVVNSDTNFERDENFFVNLSGVANAVISDAQGVATLLNDDLPSLTIDDVTVMEGHGGPTILLFKVSLQAPSTQRVMVNYRTTNGTAIAGSDYGAISGTLTFDPGVVSQTISVVINGDRALEGNEIFTLDLSNPINAVLARPQGLGKILNDD